MMHMPVHIGHRVYRQIVMFEKLAFGFPSFWEDGNRGRTWQRLVWEVPQTPSGFTQDNWEIYMDAWVIQLYNSLRCQVFLNPFQHGSFTPVFCQNRFLIELMRQVTIFIKEQRASSGEHKRCCTWKTSNSCQWVLVSIFGWIVCITWAGKRPKSFGFGATATHLQLQHIIFSDQKAARGATVLLYFWWNMFQDQDDSVKGTQQR